RHQTSVSVENDSRPGRYPPILNDPRVVMRFGGRNQRVIFESASDSLEQSISSTVGASRPASPACTHPWFPERHGGGGMSLLETSDQQRVNPLDVVERVAGSNGWAFERAGEDEITLLVTGKWSDYQVSYTWMFDIEALHLACAFELKV